MEHRDQINNEPTSKELFLQNNLAEIEKPVVYSLEAEFAKTKKNRDLKPYLLFFGFNLMLIMIAVVTTNYLDLKSKQIDIDISDFEDLRLKETLTEAIAKEEELTRKTEELNIRDEELKKLQFTYNAEIQRLKLRIGQQQVYYEKIIAELKKENSGLETYRHTLSSFLKEKNADGCILEPRRWRNPLLFIDGKVSSETTVDLFRDENTYVGKLKLIPEKTGVRAEIVEVANNQRIKPLDWFCLPNQ